MVHQQLGLFFVLEIATYSHISFSNKNLFPFCGRPNWLCLFTCLFAVRITHHAARNNWLCFFVYDPYQILRRGSGRRVPAPAIGFVFSFQLATDVVLSGAEGEHRGHREAESTVNSQSPPLCCPVCRIVPLASRFS